MRPLAAPSLRSSDLLNRGFITTEGYFDFNKVYVEGFRSERHASYVEGRDSAFPCYFAFDDCDVAYPFHTSCFIVFCARLAHWLGEDNSASVNKALLYKVFGSLASSHCYLDIDYGVPSPRCNDEFWSERAGEEIFAADPWPLGRTDELEDINKTFATMVEEAPFRVGLAAGRDLSRKVQTDAFKKLPYDILVRIGELLDDPDGLLNWAKASWFAHSQLRGAGSSFWKQAIRTQMAGWFQELVDRLDDGRLQDVAARTAYIWAACKTRPRLYMKGGYFMRLANRRRIWSKPCAELVEHYDRALFSKGGDRADGSPFQRLLQSQSACGVMYTVTQDRDAQLFGEVEKCMWIDEWEDTHAKSQTVEAFFRQEDGWLVGITITPQGGERRVLGSTEAEGVLLRSEVVVPTNDWICGILLHIPCIEAVGTQIAEEKTSIKGITVRRQPHSSVATY